MPTLPISRRPAAPRSDRSENTDLIVEISLQPYKAFQPDGVILFSDILTPLPGMGVPFDMLEKIGPVVPKPIRTAADLKALRPLVPEEAVPFAGAALCALRSELAGTGAAVLGFVGAPFTLATYMVEGARALRAPRPPRRRPAPLTLPPCAAAWGVGQAARAAAT